MNWPVSTFQRENLTKLSRAHSDKRFSKHFKSEIHKKIYSSKSPKCIHDSTCTINSVTVISYLITYAFV